MEKFLAILGEKYTLDDFTGNLGVLLADETDFEDEEQQEEMTNSALEFLQELYELASENM